MIVNEGCRCSNEFYVIADLARCTWRTRRSGAPTWSEHVYDCPTNKCETLIRHGRLLEMMCKDMSSKSVEVKIAPGCNTDLRGTATSDTSSSWPGTGRD